MICIIIISCVARAPKRAAYVILVRIPIGASDIRNHFTEVEIFEIFNDDHDAMTDPAAVRFRELPNKNYRNFLRSAVVRKINLYSIIYTRTHTIIIIVSALQRRERGWGGCAEFTLYEHNVPYYTRNPCAPYKAYSAYLRRFFAVGGGGTKRTR